MVALSLSLPTFVPFGMRQAHRFVLPPPPTTPPLDDVEPRRSDESSLRLPDLAAEIQYAIISHLSRTDLVALSLTCPFLAQTVAPFLWRTITLTGEIPDLCPLFHSLHSTLLAKPYLAAYVRSFNVELGAGEFAEGGEWELVGRLASLLPDVRELDLRSDSVGRWKGIWDPFLRKVEGRKWERLEKVAVKVLVSESGLVKEFLERHGGIKRLNLSLTHISSVYTTIPAQLNQPYNELTSQSEEDWTLSPARLPELVANLSLDASSPPLPSPPPSQPLLPDLLSLRGAVLTLSSILSYPHSYSNLESVEFDVGHPFGEEAKLRTAEELESCLMGRTSIRRLVLSGGVRPDERLVQKIARAAPQLEELDIVDSIGFFYKPPISPLTPAQLFDLPELRKLYLRAWGYLDTSLLYPVLPSLTPLPPNSNPVERVSLVSFRYEVELETKEDGYKQRVGVFKEVSE
ncbi:hypothetical protein BDY24DRAFT_104592 [Mrakia frigida]|uniref:F-box protein n=1 Tax=Mrakia frigida TaxID=29902 RepID=UPI003FCC10CC